MKPATTQLRESQRLDALRRLGLLDTQASAEIDALVRAAALACQLPMAALTLVDQDRVWFKTSVGLDGIDELPRMSSFCDHAIGESHVVQVSNPHRDERFAACALVDLPSSVRFYAGVAVRTGDAHAVGVLSVMGTQAQRLNETQCQVLEQLAIAAGRALESEAGLRQTHEQTPALIYSIDPRGRILRLSDQLAELLGYRSEELVGTSSLDIMTPQSRAFAQNEGLPQLLATGVSNALPYQLVTRDGRLLDVLISSRLVRDARGRPVQSLSSLEDVTQRLRSERELQRERQRFANIVKGTNAGTWEHDLVTGEDRVNDLYARMLGYSVADMEALISGNFFNVVHPEDRPHVGERWDAHLRGETDQYEAEFRVQHRDGHWVWVLSRGSVGDFDDSGKPLNLSGIHLDISVRRNAIETATRALRDMRNTLDALPSLVAYWDRDWRCRFSNLAYNERYKSLGKPLPGLHMSEVLPPALYRQNEPLMRAAMRGEDQNFERTVFSPDGVRHSLVRYMPDTHDGEVHGVYTFVFDITNIKQAEQALESERAQLRSILEGTNAGTWHMNMQTGDAVLNDRWAEIVGYGLGELGPQNVKGWAAMCHPDDVGRVMRTMGEHLKGGTGYYQCEYRIRHRTGHWLWVQDRGKISSRTADGAPEWVSGTHMDITDRVMAEQRLNEQLELVKVLLEATPTAIFQKDEAGRYVRFNRAFEELFGVDRADWIGRHVYELVEGEAGRAMYQLDLDLFANGQLQTYEAQFVNRTTGEMREGLYYKAPLRDGLGKVTGLVGTILDVTERNRVARDLERAKGEAEAATEAKGRFLANMSHELRTPMNAVLGMLKLLQTTELNMRQLDYVSKTESAAKSLLGLLNDILDFSKMEAGKMELDPQVFRLDRLLRDLAVVLSSTVGSKGIEVLYDIAPDMPEVVIGDPMRLRQVLINLGGNAIKFTEVGQVVLSIRVGTDEQSLSGLALEFAVTDSGIGIAPEHQARIFSGFSQAEASTTRRFGGTGLGLAISQRLVEMMGGKIHIDSTPGRGSRFWFRLPMQVPDHIPSELEEEHSVPGDRRRVLVVDDNPLARSLMVQVTRSWGWPTEEVGDGASALAWVQERSAGDAFPFDVMYVDWQMPGLDGWDTIAGLRALARQRGATPQIVMVTANGRESLAQRTSEEQAMLDGFLVKPVTASMMLDAVVRHRPQDLGLRAARRSSRRQLAGMRILVVEDNLINQQVAEELLLSEGALVSLAADGRQGVNAVAQAHSPYDAVLMDVQMPVLDGYEATQEIRTVLGLTELPIIGLTANAMAADREACLRAGMNEHMGKPFDLAQLVSMLIRLTRRIPRGDAGEGETPATDDPASYSPGVDSDDLQLTAALQRMSGMTSLYIRAARDFHQTLDSLQEEIRGHLLRGDTHAVVTLLHTNKGTSATLGLMRLSAECAQLERWFKSQSETHDGLRQIASLAPVITAARIALQAAVRHLGGGQPVQLRATVDLGGVSVEPSAGQGGGLGMVAPDSPAYAALQTLLPLLEASDLTALEWFAEHRAAFETLPAGPLEALDHALQGLDLASALALCRQLLV